MTSVDPSRHPCFNPEMKGRCGRVHLPVAPKCNIKCNYCNRLYDCVNESRPGVTSTVLSPSQSVEYVRRVLAKEPRITVAGIAGPGDPFANPEETMKTLRLVRREFPGLILCLASNGMGIGPYIDELAELSVSHVTITINAVDPDIGGRIYSWARDGKLLYRGTTAAKILLARQIEAVRRLKENGITVKINSIVVPGVNDEHIPEVAAAMKELGADLFNCMAMFPNVDTPFANIVEPSKARVEELRSRCETHLPQMRHCTRCRADAVGLLNEDRTSEMRGCLTACAQLPEAAPAGRPYVAVASMEGILVNLHLGEAERFQIWERAAEGYRLVEERPAPAPGGGLRRWISLGRRLKDCRAVLVAGVGETPAGVLKKSGLEPLTVSGFIEEGLKAVYEGKELAAIRARRAKACAGGCGTGPGCA